MISDTVLSPPFWPSRRLWLKLFLGGVVAPINVIVLVFFFVRAGFEGGAYTILFFSAVIGGPIAVGILLSPSWRGVVAGILATTGMVLAWGFVNTSPQATPIIRVFEWFGESLLVFALIAYIGVGILEVVTRDVRERYGLVGLGVGGVAGFLLTVAYTYFSTNIFQVNAFVLWPTSYALVWLSAFFFPELLTRRVGWGGVLVWVGLVVAIFGAVIGLSFAFAR